MQMCGKERLLAQEDAPRSVADDAVWRPAHKKSDASLIKRATDDKHASGCSACRTEDASPAERVRTGQNGSERVGQTRLRVYKCAASSAT